MEKLIVKMESIFKTDIRYLLKGGFWLNFTQGVSLLSSFALALVCARFLSKTTYGEYKYILSFGGILCAITLTGFPTAITQSVARGYEGTLSKAFKENLKWSFLMILVCFGIAIYYFTKHNSVYGFSMLVMGITLPLFNSASFSDAFLVAKKKFRASAIYNIVSSVLLSAILIVTILLKQNLLVLIVVYFTSSTLIEYCIYLITIKKYPPSKLVDEHALDYAVHLSGMNILGTIADRIDSLLIFHYLGAVDLAIYTFSVALPEQIKGFTKNISSLALPRFSERKIEQVQSSMTRKIIYTTLFMTIIIIMYILIAPFIFYAFFPQYLTSILYSQIYSISVLFVANSQLPTSALQAVVAKKQLHKYNLLSSLLQIILLFVGIKYYGILGAIIAITVVRAVRLFYSWYLVSKLKSIPQT
ncbi:MAG: oligosaccharide flippase family protein [Candidatus Pacebacteria bacterium]|nr:oligosaccharide flippase family protein [Candidatus Paceibacterota bacterium]